MAQKIDIILICDLCYSENDVEEHTIKVDKATATKDVCPDCWEFILDTIKDFMAKPQPAARKASPSKSALAKSGKRARSRASTA